MLRLSRNTSSPLSRTMTSVLPPPMSSSMVRTSGPLSPKTPRAMSLASSAPGMTFICTSSETESMSSCLFEASLAAHVASAMTSLAPNPLEISANLLMTSDAFFTDAGSIRPSLYRLFPRRTDSLSW